VIVVLTDVRSLKSRDWIVLVVSFYQAQRNGGQLTSNFLAVEGL
jgi:hypothetical protein